MSREVTSTVYTFDELTDAAKERARQWWRECENQDFGADGMLFEPAETAAKLLGIEFDTRPVKLMGGGTRYESKIWWSGFSSQGDGASFEAHYRYAKHTVKSIRQEFPTDTELHRIALGLAEIQKKHGYRITAHVSQSGSYVHKYTMSADVLNGDNAADAETAESVLTLMRDFADWIYDGIRQEYEYRMSDEQVDDAITANEYEFNKDGSIA